MMREPMDLRHLTICVNNDCNMNCSYCFRKKDINKKKEFTDWGHLSAFLSWSQDIQINPYSLHVMFTGGEPLLNPDNIRDGVKALHPFRKETNLKFGVSTNLTKAEDLLELLDDDVLDFDGVSISWDGLSRYDLIDDLEYWINKYDAYYPNENIYHNLLIKISVSKDLYKDHTLTDSTEYLNDYGFTNIQYYFVNGTYDYKDESFKEKFRNDLENLLKKDWSERIVNNVKWNKGYVESEYKFNGYFHTYCNKLSHLLYVDTEGQLWPCAFYSDESKAINNQSSYLLGNIRDREVNRDVFKKLSCDNWQYFEDQFCHACTNKCADLIREMKKIELDVYSNHYK